MIAEPRFDCLPKLMSKTIYVLLCAERKYYIGKTIRPMHERTLEHFASSYGASAWTKKYPPICIVETFQCASEYDEDNYTKKYMRLCGIANVRGGSYVQIELPEYKVRALEDEFSSADDSCFKCHKPGHFMSRCPQWKDVNQRKDVEYRKDVDQEGWCCAFVKAAIEGLLLALSTSSVCQRCGRDSHTIRNCYAKWHINGSRL